MEDRSIWMDTAKGCDKTVFIVKLNECFEALDMPKAEEQKRFLLTLGYNEERVNEVVAQIQEYMKGAKSANVHND